MARRRPDRPTAKQTPDEQRSAANARQIAKDIEDRLAKERNRVKPTPATNSSDTVADWELPT
jgi:hypothetical protein